jgi:hypothetical protein
VSRSCLGGGGWARAKAQQGFCRCRWRRRSWAPLPSWRYLLSALPFRSSSPEVFCIPPATGVPCLCKGGLRGLVCSSAEPIQQKTLASPAGASSLPSLS